MGYILSFSLVRLRTIRFSARAGAHIECSSRSCAEDVTITNVIIKTPESKYDWGVNDVMPGSEGLGILGIFFKKAVSWDLSLGEASWDSDLGETSPVVVYGMRRAFVGSVSWDWTLGRRVQQGIWLKDDVGTVSIVRIVCLSLLLSNKLKVKKVNKRFVPELKKVVSIFRYFHASGYTTYLFRSIHIYLSILVCNIYIYIYIYIYILVCYLFIDRHIYRSIHRSMQSIIFLYLQFYRLFSLSLSLSLYIYIYIYICLSALPIIFRRLLLWRAISIFYPAI